MSKINRLNQLDLDKIYFVRLYNSSNIIKIEYDAGGFWYTWHDIYKTIKDYTIAEVYTKEQNSEYFL